MIELSTYEAISLGINVASLVVLGIIAYFQLKISRRDIEKPNLEGESYIRELRDEENEVTSFLMNVVNKGPGDARDIEIRAISFAGFFGERSPENPYTQRHINPELVSLSKTHVGKGEELVITAPLPEGESENIPNKIDRVSVNLKTQKTTQRVVFCNDKSMPSRESNYEGESDYYGSDASIPVELEISKRPIIGSMKN